MSEFAPIFEDGLTTAVFVGSSLMFLAVFAGLALYAGADRSALRPMMLKAGMAVVAFAIGAIAIEGWRGETRAIAGISTAAQGSMAGLIREFHTNPAAHRLPVQAIVDYN